MKLPQGISISVSEGSLTVSAGGASLSRKFNPRVMKVSVNEGEVVAEAIGKLSSSKRAAVNAIEAHLRNMVKGLQDGFSKKLTIIYAHFPISVEVKGDHVLIKNFLGEKSPRTAKIVAGCQVKADKQEVNVSGIDREAVGQTAANIIQAVRIRKRDVRIFQDGVYLVE